MQKSVKMIIEKSSHIQNTIPELKTFTLVLLNWELNSVKGDKSTKYIWGRFLFKKTWATWIKKLKFSKEVNQIKKRERPDSASKVRKAMRH